MENDQKKKLDLVFEEDFQKLNVLLSNNGFPSCKAFGKTSFKSSYVYNNDLAKDTNVEDEGLSEYEDPQLKFVSSQTLIEDDYFLPTQSPIKAIKTRRQGFNVRKNREHYNTYSKILI